MNVRPLGERILIRRVEAATRSASGLFLPESSAEAPQEGTVLALGASADSTVKLGDRVVFGRFSGVKIQVQGEDLLILEAADVLGILEA